MTWFDKDRYKKLFIIVSVLFVVCSFYVCMVRFQILPIYIRENTNYKHTTDYKGITQLSAIAASGIWPWTTRSYLYRGLPIIPIFFIYMMGYTSLCGLVIRFTGLLPEFVVYVLMPFLVTLLLPLVIWYSSKKMKLTPEQTILFLFLTIFVMDYSIMRFHGPKGEVLGVYMGILGLAYYKNREYIYAGLFCGLASLLNFTNIAIILILLGTFILTTIMSVLRRQIIEKKRIITFLIAGCMVFPFFYIHTVPVEVNYGLRDDRLLEPIFLDEPLPPVVIAPDYMGVWEGTVLNRLKTIDSGKNPSPSVLIPNTLKEFVPTLFYPITYPYWGYVGRSAIGRVSRLFGCELTHEQVTELRNFKLTATSVLTVGIVLWYTSGFPFIFGLAWWSLLKQKKIEDVLLALSAYSLPVFSALFRVVFGWSIAARRLIPFVEVFYMMILLHQVPHLGARENKFLKIICVIMVIRFVVWFAASYIGPVTGVVI